jgi:hypothetical protein
MAPNRSILSLPLPKSTIASLTAAGFETLKDLLNATADGLAHGEFISFKALSHGVYLIRIVKTSVYHMRSPHKS